MESLSQVHYYIKQVIKENNIQSIYSVDENLFSEDEYKIVECVKDHYHKFKDLPSESTLEEDYGFVLPDNPIQNSDFYLEKIKQNFARRVSETFVDEWETKTLEGSESILELYKQCCSALESTVDHKYHSNFVDSLEQSIINARQNRAKPELMGVKLGLPPVDDMLHGMLPGDVFLLYAPSGSKKSWLTASFMSNAVDQGMKILYINMEMSKQESADRFLGLRTGINADRIMTGKMSNVSYNKLRQEVDVLRKKEPIIFVDGDFSYDIGKIESDIIHHRPDVIYLDGLYLVQDDSRFNKADWERQKRVIESLKSYMKKYNMCCFATTQMINQNRATKKASQGNVSGGKALIDTVSVAFEVREYESDPRFLQVSMTKVRRNVPKNKRDFLIKVTDRSHKFEFDSFIVENEDGEFIQEEGDFNLDEVDEL